MRGGDDACSWPQRFWVYFGRDDATDPICGAESSTINIAHHRNTRFRTYETFTRHPTAIQRPHHKQISFVGIFGGDHQLGERARIDELSFM